MKKITLLFFAMITIATVKSQQLSQGDGMINLGLGLSSYYTSGNGYKTKLPPIEGSYESMVSENISVGGFIGMYKSEYFYNYDGGGYDSGFDFTTKFNYFDLGAIGNYHFVNTDKFNAYAGARLGYVSSKVSYEGLDLEDDYFNEFLKNRDYKSSGAFFALQIGARYFLSDSFALNAELGYGVSLLKVGATIKL